MARWCSLSLTLMGTATFAAPLKWSVNYPDHLCSAPVILCQVFSSPPVFFSSRSHLSFSCFLLSRRGFVDFHPAPPPNKPCATFSHSCLSSPECHWFCALCPVWLPPHSLLLRHLAVSHLRRPVLWWCGRVSRGRWQPSLGQGWAGEAHSHLLEKPLTSQA